MVLRMQAVCLLKMGEDGPASILHPLGLDPSARSGPRFLLEKPWGGGEERERCSHPFMFTFFTQSLCNDFLSSQNFHFSIFSLNSSLIAFPGSAKSSVASGPVISPDPIRSAVRFWIGVCVSKYWPCGAAFPGIGYTEANTLGVSLSLHP